MKGLVKFSLGENGVGLRELPEPSPRPGELKVKVLAAGICGSDIHAIRDQRAVNMPVVLGHEYVGQVAECCGDVGDFRPGDWVMTLPACYSCGSCELCREGLVTLCRQRRSIGSHVDGAMANFVVVPAKYSFRVPERAKSLEEKMTYALTEPFCCVVRGVYERIDVKPGDLAVVSGPGTIGIMAAMLFKSRGAQVIVSGLPSDREKLELALKMGADEAVTSAAALAEAVRGRKPEGADITCEAAGAAPSLRACLSVLRTHGVHLQVGLFGKPVECDIDGMFLKEATLVTTNSTAVSSWELGLRLLEERKFDLTPLISMRLPLERWKEGFDAMIGQRAYRALLLPDNKYD